MGLALPTEAGPGEPTLDGEGLGFWMRELDADKSRGIDADEFYVALSRWGMLYFAWCTHKAILTI